MLANVGWFLLGLAALIVGAEVMVKGGSRLAGRLGISPIVVGLTVVSIGTSMPELAVGVAAAGQGSGALAVGNIAGTNVVNLLLILGLSAAMVPLVLQARTIRFELPMMAAAAVLLFALSADGVLSRVDGVILLTGAVAYTAVVVWSARCESREVMGEFAAVYAKDAPVASAGAGRSKTPLLLVMLVGGIGLVVVGAEWLVDGAVGMAGHFGVSDALIGLTVVAIGTSAPELVTTVMSTLRGDRDIAIGNLMGSSIYNIALILGVTCMVPAHGLVLPSSLVRIDIPIMVIVALVCVPLFVTGRRVSRPEGAAMVGAYAAYLMFCSPPRPDGAGHYTRVVLIGSHVHGDDPLAAADADGADVVQFFLGNPQSWKKPKPREDADVLKASDIPLYIHAPYLINVASANNRVRIPSRKILQDTCDAAADVGATAVIVHGGHADDKDWDAGFERWVKALDYLETDVPVYLENTAGGDHAMARHFDVIARLWDHIGDKGIGFCLDTCHAWAAGEALIDAVDRIKAITGRIDLVHCNDSRDAAGSGADRHANFGTGQIDPALLVAVVKAADAPVICETADEGRKDDIAFLREHLD